jgi:Tol biopolymer transport system component
MTGNRSNAIASLCLVVAAGILLVSCEGPAKPGDPPPPPPPPGPQSKGPIAFVSDRDGTQAIYLANEDGSAITRLTEGWAPAWSRDGRKIAFERGREIYVINVDGSGLQRVTQGHEPSWSPDGRTIALDNGAIYTVDVDGSNRRAIYSKLPASQPVWSPDGRLIAFDTYEDADNFTALGLVTADGSDDQYIVAFSYAWAPAWSRDGSQIAFVTGFPSGIGVVGADGSGQRQLLAGWFLDVDWTPDGRLVFSKLITSTSNYEGPSRIFISDGVEKQLIPDATAPARQIYRDWQVAWLR